MKKQSFITILLTVLMSMVGAKAFAHDIAVENADGVTIYYNWINNQTKLAVSYSSDYDEYSDNVVIPESVVYEGNTYNVTSIGKSAFNGCSGLISVTIPNSVTSIGNYAFKNCSGLISIVIPSSVTSIGEEAFRGCSGLTSITIPNSVKSIGDAIFMSCSSLTSITIPSSVTSIGEDAFKNCSGLTSITIPNSVTSIGIQAFAYCSSLTSIEIPSSVTILDWCLFFRCTSLTSVTIPNSVTSIGEKAFSSCSSLTSIEFPSSVKDIFEQAFSDCSSLTSIVIPSSVWFIGEKAFSGCSSLTSVISRIKDPFYLDINTDTFHDNTFHNGTLYVPKGTIDKYKTTDGWKNFVFIEESDNGNITKYKLTYLIDGEEYKSYEIEEGSSVSPEPVPTKDGYTFSGWSDIPKTMPDHDVTVTGSFTLIPLSNEVVIDGFNYHLDSQTMTATVISGENNLSGDVVIPSQVSNNGETYDVTGIERLAFNALRNLTSITIPSSITSIGYEAFCDCNRLTSVHITDLEAWCKIDFNFPDSQPLTYAHHLYLNGEEVKDLIIPNSISRIRWLTFYGCSGLTTVTIPNSVTSIGRGAFQNCTGLEIIDSNIEWPSIIEENTFSEETYLNAQLIVPAGTKSAYQSTEGWNKFQNIVEADEITDNDVNYTIEGETVVVSMSTSVKGELRIKESVEIDGKTYQVTAIASGAFQGNVEITSVVIPNSIETIGASAIEGCTGISTIIIGKAVKEIASRAFAEIFNVRTRTRAEGVGIDVYCYAEEVPITGGDAFDGTPTELSTLHVPLSAIEKYKTSWPWSDFKEIVPLANSSFTQNGINYAVKDDGTLEVTGIEDGTTIVDLLSDVYIDGNTYQVTSIGAYAFEGRSDISYLSIPWSVTSIGEYAFVDCGSNLTVNIADPESWCQMKLGNEHSSPLSSAKKVLVHDIETDQIDIPEGVTSINSFTFYQCRSIKSLNIPATVTSIGSSAFEDCTGLTALSLSEGLETIGGSAFQGCTGLQTLTIPSTVKSIYINALANCKGITDVYCYAENIPETDFDAFDSTPTETSTLHVPANAVEAYKVTWPWSDFKEIVALDEEAPDGINGVKQSDGIKAVYSVRGEIIQRPLKGINIIKMKDGTVKKVFEK